VTRFAVGLLAIVTVLSGVPVSPGPVEGRGQLSSRVAAVRSSQKRLESSVRTKDRRVKHMKRERAQVRAKLRKTRARLAHIRSKRREARRDIGTARARLSHVRRAGVKVAGSNGRRHRAGSRLSSKIDRLQRKTHRLDRKERRAVRQRHALGRRVARMSDRVATVKGRRSVAQRRLAGQIGVMTSLAKRRAARHFRPGSRMRWPVKGRISQRYGCTGFRLASRRGSCRNFHDGIDIVAPLGTRVRAAAGGVVSYVGWSPLGSEKRAFIVVIGHAGGLETLYGHLLPRRRVHSGQVVRKGQVIGLLGNTGRSTGPHVHWEVSRGFRTLNPRKHM
jgi:murein DD-endopeptidase MepM/ murein hydrolase activator NlpD